MSPILSTLPQPRHVLCRTTMLYQVVRLKFCPCGRTFTLVNTCTYLKPSTQTHLATMSWHIVLGNICIMYLISNGKPTTCNFCIVTVPSRKKCCGTSLRFVAIHVPRISCLVCTRPYTIHMLRNIMSYNIVAK